MNSYQQEKRNNTHYRECDGDFSPGATYVHSVCPLLRLKTTE
jgi:hypothetical protein